MVDEGSAHQVTMFRGVCSVVCVEKTSLLVSDDARRQNQLKNERQFINQNQSLVGLLLVHRLECIDRHL